mgnify:CR=1 FL=1|jgi:hypothetical protein
MGTTQFNASEFCSRKLWQMVNRQQDRQVSNQELEEAINELATRRHYLAELREIGKLEERTPGA